MKHELSVRRLFVSILIGLGAWSLAAHAVGSGDELSGAPVVQVAKAVPTDQGSTNKCVRVTMPAMPPSRTWCTLESRSQGTSATAEWDPLRPGPLTREFRLPMDDTRDDRELSCYSEAIRPSLKPGLNLAWRFENRSEGCTSSCRNKQNQTEPKCVTECRKASQEELAVLVHNGRSDEQDNLTELVVRINACGDVQPDNIGIGTSPTAEGGQLRAFAPAASELADETFQVIADVILSRVKEKGLQLIAKRVEKLVCEAGLEFPATCEMIRTARLRDLAASGRQLEKAVSSDLLRLIENKMHPWQDYKEELLLGIAAASDLITRPGRRSNASSEILLRLLEKLSSETGELKSVALVVAECHRSGACDAASIRKRFLEPEDYYGSGYVKVNWQRAQSFVTDSLTLLAPPTTSSEAENLRRAVDLVLDVAEYKAQSLAVGSKERTALRHWRTLVHGMTERDLMLQLSATASLLDAQTATPEQMRRLASIISALVAFRKVDPTASEEERAAQREAKEAALSSLIDEFTSRSERQGDWVLSLGSSIGAAAGVALGADDDPQDPSFLASPTLSLGVGLDYHDASNWGFHGEFAPIDFGGYLSFKTNRNGEATEEGTAGDDAEAEEDTADDGSGVVPADVGDVLRPSIAAAVTYLFEDADLIFFFGVRAGYAVKTGAGEDEQGPFVLGSLGAYVPILDFN